MKEMPHHSRDPELGIDNADAYLEFLAQLLVIRKLRGYTRQDVARRMGTSDRVVSELERGISNPTVAQLHRYAEAVGIYVSLLAARKENRSSWIDFVREATHRLRKDHIVIPTSISSTGPWGTLTTRLTTQEQTIREKLPYKAERERQWN